MVAGAEADDEDAEPVPRSRREKFETKKTPATARDVSTSKDARSASRSPQVRESTVLVSVHVQKISLAVLFLETWFSFNSWNWHNYCIIQ